MYYKNVTQILCNFRREIVYSKGDEIFLPVLILFIIFYIFFRIVLLKFLFLGH